MLLTKENIYINSLGNIIESHDLALNSVMEALTYDINDKTYFIPYLQPNDCNLSNLELSGAFSNMKIEKQDIY